MIDVLIPCRNGGDKMLAPLVRSLEAQTAKINIEVMFADGLLLYELRNALLKRGTGEYVYYVDADDWLQNETALEELQEALQYDYAWGDMWAYVTPLDKTIHINQAHPAQKPACGSWLARRDSFPPDPWQPMDRDPHRSDWIIPQTWRGTYVEVDVFTYRVAWSDKQLTARPIIIG
jgi:glycosyltransferase involved in cell wall biosynthesis